VLHSHRPCNSLNLYGQIIGDLPLPCHHSPSSFPNGHSGLSHNIRFSRTLGTAISDLYSTHPLLQRILTLLTTVTSVGRNVIFIWMPGHIGTTGNERVDRAVKLVAQYPHVNLKALPTNLDLVYYIRQYTEHWRWNLQWQKLRPHNEIAQLKNLPTSRASSDAKTRRQIMVLTCLRIGYKRITRSNLVFHLSFMSHLWQWRTPHHGSHVFLPPSNSSTHHLRGASQPCRSTSQRPPHHLLLLILSPGRWTPAAYLTYVGFQGLTLPQLLKDWRI